MQRVRQVLTILVVIATLSETIDAAEACPAMVSSGSRSTGTGIRLSRKERREKEIAREKQAREAQSRKKLRDVAA